MVASADINGLTKNCANLNVHHIQTTRLSTVHTNDENGKQVAEKMQILPIQRIFKRVSIDVKIIVSLLRRCESIHDASMLHIRKEIKFMDIQFRL